MSVRLATARAGSDLCAERARQVRDEGWSEAHDDRQTDHQLCEAAAAYLLATRYAHTDAGLRAWPWGNRTFKPGAARRNLVKAGALILAEIERLDRGDG